MDQVQTLQVAAKDLTLPNLVVRDLMQTALQRGAPFRLRALGSSMSPIIRPGDVLTINPIRPGEPALGQVVAFIHPQNGLLLIHRVVQRHGSVFLILGDNMRGRNDGLVPVENILGRVVQVSRNGRRVYFGQGLAGAMIALLSRFGLLSLILAALRRLRAKRARFET
jgi:hypothetical protein